MNTQAWTGGDRPCKYSTLTKREKYIVSEVFRDYVCTYVKRWGNIEPDMVRLFWSRARYDAHATYRETR
jgi:hypothetical protein